MAMNIEDEMLDRAGREIADEIDWEIMSNFMVELGWTKINVSFGPLMTESMAHEIKEWTKAYCTGNFKSRGKTWVFENAEDATLFTLRWAT